MALLPLTVLAAEGAEHSMLEVMMSTLPAGIIAAAVFALLGLVTLSYRNVANRHAAKADRFAASHASADAHGAGHEG